MKCYSRKFSYKLHFFVQVYLLIHHFFSDQGGLISLADGPCADSSSILADLVSFVDLFTHIESNFPLLI